MPEFTQHPKLHKLERNGRPGLFCFNGTEITTANYLNYQWLLCGNYILTKPMWKFYNFLNFDSTIKQQPLLDFVYRELGVSVYSNMVLTDKPVSKCYNFKFFKGKRQYYKFKFDASKPFDARDLDNVVNAFLYQVTPHLMIGRRHRDVDMVGLVHPPLIEPENQFEPYRDTQGETWDE